MIHLVRLILDSWPNVDSLNLTDVIYNARCTLHTFHRFSLQATDSTKRNVIFNVTAKRYRMDGADKSEFGQTVTRWP